MAKNLRGKTMLNNNLSIHRPAWTQGDLKAGNHLHLPVRKDGKVIALIHKNYFLRTKGFAKYEDLLQLL